MDLNPLALHINYLYAADYPFRRSWSRRGSHCGPRLQTLEQSRRAMGGDLAHVRAAHRRATRTLLRIAGDLPDYDFRITPRASQWASFSRAPRRVSSFCGHAFSRLRRVISELGPFPCYGGVKDQEGVKAKIRCGKRAGLPADLWDLVRFRVVCADIHELAPAVRQLLTYFGDGLVRCRNYYVNPRNGMDDPYRGFHLELRYDSEEFIEIQLVTLNREAVGNIDHPLVLKHRVSPLGSWHACWLRKLSWMANVADAGCAQDSLRSANS